MRNIAKARVRSMLGEAVNRVTPYPLDFTLSSVLDQDRDQDYSADIPERLVDSFAKLPGFSNTASASMLHDEISAALLPSSHVAAIDYYQGRSCIRMTDEWWLSVARDMILTEHSDRLISGQFEVIVDLTDPEINQWTRRRGELFKHTLQKLTKFKVVDFMAQTKIIIELSEDELLALATEEIGRLSDNADHLKEALQTYLDFTSDNRPITILQSLLALIYLKKHLGESSSRFFKS